MSDVLEFDAPAVADVEEAPWERRARLFGPLVIAACGLLAYCNSFQVPFVFDAANYLKDNDKIRQIIPPNELLTFAQTRPVGYLSFALNYQIGLRVLGDGYNRPFWHATNLAIHVAAACALFGIARRTLRSPRLVERFGPSAARVALAIALVWVVHPLCTQSVTYLYQRLESLMGMFYLGSLYGFVRFAEARRWWWAAAAVVSCALAASTKEVAVTAPIMVLWYDRAFLASSWDELMRRRGTVHALLFASLVVPAALMLPMLRGTYQSAGILDTSRITPAEYARTQPEVVQHYLRLAVVPWPLNIDYAWKVQDDRRRVVVPATLIGVLAVLTLVAIWKWPALGFLGGWWFVILAPTSSFAPIIDLAFEHRTYLPLIAPVALLVTSAYVILGRCVDRAGGDSETAGACRAALLTVVVAALTTLTIVRNHDYRSELALWRDVAKKVPHNQRGHYNYGVYLQTAGSPAEIDEAIHEYHETLKLDENYAEAYLNLGNLAAFRRNDLEARSHYEKYLALKPDDAEALSSFAETLERLGDRDEAERRARRVLELEPANARGRALLDRLTASPTPSASR